MNQNKLKDDQKNQNSKNVNFIKIEILNKSDCRKWYFWISFYSKSIKYRHWIVKLNRM